MICFSFLDKSPQHSIGQIESEDQKNKSGNVLLDESIHRAAYRRLN